MTDRSAFLEQIFDDPESDLPRLIFADWLDDRGDPLGEFIRLEMDLLHLSRDDPRWDALHQRDCELILRHKDEWGVASLRGVALHWDFRRGLLEEVNIHAHSLAAHGERVLGAAPIWHLLLSGDYQGAGNRRPNSMPRALQSIAENPRLEQIVHLQGSYSLCLGDEGAQILLGSSHWKRLRQLQLGDALLTDATVAFLCRQPLIEQLDFLNLRSNSIQGEGAWLLVQAMARNPRLRLNLLNCPLDESTMALFHTEYADRATVQWPIG